MADIRLYVSQDTLPTASENTYQSVRGSKRGELYIADFYLRHVLEQRAYQVRAGTITAPLTGDIDITDTAADMCADVATGVTLIPIYLNADVESLNGGTLPICTAKSVATVSSAGTAFTPLPMYSGGAASRATARVQAAGAVTVTAELATTTLRHYSKTVAVAAGEPLANFEWKMPPILNGPRCFYVQVAGITAGPLYFASFDFIEMLTANVD